MFDQNKHKVILIEILKDIYSDPDLRTVLGFKGGTAAMLFYDLPRLSVDLDFDLLNMSQKEMVFEKIKTILTQHGILRGELKIKIDISKHKSTSGFELKNYLGIPVFLMKQEDMTASKLSALLTRKKFAMRDVFDLWFFLKNKWLINEALLTEKTELSLNKALELAIKKINGISKNQLLHGLGELLEVKQKAWIKEKLTSEIILYLTMKKKSS